MVVTDYDTNLAVVHDLDCPSFTIAIPRGLSEFSVIPAHVPLLGTEFSVRESLGRSSHALPRADCELQTHLDLLRSIIRFPHGKFENYFPTISQEVIRL